MENEILELTITGVDLASELRRMVVPSLDTERYFIEVVKITETLLEHNKTWEDIEKITYRVGMRAPLNPTYHNILETTIDGYEITIHLK